MDFHSTTAERPPVVSQTSVEPPETRLPAVLQWVPGLALVLLALVHLLQVHHLNATPDLGAAQGGFASMNRPEWRAIEIRILDENGLEWSGALDDRLPEVRQQLLHHPDAVTLTEVAGLLAEANWIRLANDPKRPMEILPRDVLAPPGWIFVRPQKVRLEVWHLDCEADSGKLSKTSILRHEASRMESTSGGVQP